MTTPVVLRIQQQGYVRATGYQATQWAVTIPIVVSPETDAIGTNPLSFAPLFVVDTSGPVEVLRRVATLRDYAELPQSELRYFEPRSLSTGWQLLAQALAGDTLRIVNAPGHWLQDQTPYTDSDFVVGAVQLRTSGSAPQTFLGNTLALPGYVPTPEDVGRWVRLDGFTSGSYNAWVQIVSYVGNVVTVNRTFTTVETGASWNTYWLLIADGAGYHEPRLFPTKERNLSWALIRSGSTLASGTGGGASTRGGLGNVVRSVRWTQLAATQGAATDLFVATSAQLQALQVAAATVDSDFTPLHTVTEGP